MHLLMPVLGCEHKSGPLDPVLQDSAHIGALPEQCPGDLLEMV